MRSGLRVALAVAGLRGDARIVPSGRNSVAPDERRGFADWGQYLETAMASQVEGTPIVRDRRFGAGLAVLFGGGSLGSSVTQQMVSPQLGLH